ncbi:MAG: TonB-dependent receptor [Bryobacteraceae bacterium]|nr:TonB-dependent receptor [Bryobacteraceae bacterium]
MRRISCVSLLSCCLLVSLFGQIQTGRIEGTVQDSSGAVIPGAKLSAINVKTQVKVDMEADASGYYIFPSLQPGFYTVSAEAPGFRKASVTNIELNLGVTLRQDIRLEVGTVTDTVTVEASAVRVQTSEATIQRAVTMRDIDTLPQLARNPIALATFQPGVQIGTTAGDPSFARINGLRQGSNNNTLDGIDVNDSVLPRLGLTLNATNTDSVEEFRIITNGAKAEYGRNAGGQVELITRSGTNRFSGNLFEYHRNTVLNANNFFNNTSGQQRPKFIQNQFGGSFGGPVLIPKVYNGKDKLFFFYNYQGSRVAQQVVRNRTVLTPEAKQGIFRWRVPGSNELRSFNIVANDPRGIGIDPAVARNLALLPNPNNFDTGDLLNTAGYRFNAPAGGLSDQSTFKTDWNPASTLRLYFRYSWFKTLTPADTLNNAEATFPGQPNGTQGGLRSGFSAGGNWTIKPWLVNEVIVGYQQSSVIFGRVRSEFFRGVPLISSNLFTDPIPTGFGSDRNSPVKQVTDNLSILRGRHSFKGGFRISQTLQYQSADANIWPTINLTQGLGNAAPGNIGPSGATVITAADRLRFDNLYNDLLGRVSSINQTVYSDLETFFPGQPRVRNFLFNDYGYYFQDDWRVASNFTLNLGVRWEFFGVPYERDQLQGNIDQQTLGLINPVSQIADLTVRRSRNWYSNDWNNFAPRIGFAWDPFKNGKTSIRASWGVFYDRVIGAAMNDVDANMPGFAQQIQVQPNQAGAGSDVRVSDRNLTFPAPPARPTLTPAANRTSTTLALIDPNFRQPYVLQMNFTIQRELFRNTVLEAGYVGNRGVKQVADLNINQTRIYSSGFLRDFRELQAFQSNGAAPSATNALVRMYGSAAGAINAIGATPVRQGSVGAAASTVDINGFSRYPTSVGTDFYLRNFPQFQNVVLTTNAGRTQYDSLQVSLRRQAGALKGAVNYTWSKTIDNISVDGSGFTSPIDNFNLSLNRARSDADRPHTLNWSVSYTLPIGKGRFIGGGMPDWVDRIAAGWEIGSLGIWTSGPVMTVTSGLTTGSQNSTNTWANYSGDRSIGSVQRLGNGVRFFTPEQALAFTAPEAGFVGTSGRNTFRGPGLFTTDLSVVKRFRVYGERTFVTFRAEAYNLLNNVNFATPGLNLQTPQTLGVIQSQIGGTGGPRVMQMALRLDF